MSAPVRSHSWHFRLLGPLEVVRDGEPVPLGPAKQRALLVGLLLEGGRPLSTDRLVQLLWDENPPSSALANVRTYTARLRAALADPAAAQGSRLLRRRPGYLVAAGPAELDVRAFTSLAAEGRRALADRRFDLADAHLSRALSLWQGATAAEDVVPGDALAARLAVFDDLRLAVFEDHAEARLARGRHAALVPELRTAVAEHPLRERLWGQLIVALYRCGDLRGALSAYDGARVRLAEELGVEPGQELRRLQRAVLARDRQLVGTGPRQETPVALIRPRTSRAVVAPREVPAAVKDLIGRTEELAAVERALISGPGAVVIHGMAGTGRAAVAHRVAHRLASRFRDGQLCVPLLDPRDGRPLGALAAIGRALRSLGVPAGEVPDDEAEAAARFRSIAHGRRLLVVLADAVSEAQVRPFLPATAGAGLVATSWSPLPAVPAVRVPVGPLARREAVMMLARGCGRRRVSGELAAANRLADLCERLPLAIQLAGARLVADPDLALAALADELADDDRRLDGLRAGDLTIRDGLRTGYLSVRAGPYGERDARLFRLLGTVRAPVVSVPIGAALLDVPPAAAAYALDRLAVGKLLVRCGPDRFRMPDLLRLYAAERAYQDEPRAVRQAALERVLAHLLGADRHDLAGAVARLTGAAG